ncbi:hypothetical protein ACWATR_35210 [Nostoc sp. UIC 10890]
MSPKYRKGQKVQVYSPGQQIIRVIAEVRPTALGTITDELITCNK